MKKKYDWSQPITNDQLDNMIRASGLCECAICGEIYYKHPMEDRILSGVDQRPFLVRHCDGTLLKL